MGTAGTFVVVLAYLGTQPRTLDAAGLAFPVANLLGALLITASLAVNVNFASVLMEVFWIAISLFGIGRWLHERRARAPGAAC